MKKLIVIIVVLVAVGAGAGAYYIRKGGPEPQVTTAQISRGDIVDTVGATGTLEAVTTVQVGTQVSGTVQELYADFNSIVHKGQIIARLDPSLIQTQIEQQRANVVRSEADLERLKVTLADTQQKLKRAEDLAARKLIPPTELETAQVNVRSADAQLKSSQASLTQARAALHNQEVNLEHTVIAAPIDGIVISRNVDVGQTVAASMQAPTLFVIAADLTKMQVNASIDEADVGRIRPNQVVRFRVDAYPTDEFIGSVQQVRLEPKTVQNVVTYNTVISVPNPQLKLKPGMTANVNIEIARRTNVLRVPNAALRFRPTTEIFAALNQPVPPEMQRGQGGRGTFGRSGQGQFGPGGQGAGGQPGAAQAAPASAERGGQANAPSQGAPAANPQVRSGAGRPQAPASQRREETQANAQPQRGGDQASAGQRGAGPGGEGGAFSGGRGGFDPNMTPEERRKRFEERLAQMTPEERAAFEERMRQRQAQGGLGGRFGGPGGAPEGGQQAQRGESGAFTRGGGDRQPAAATRTGGATSATRPGRVASVPSMVSGGATTIDSLFGPLPAVESFGRAWLYINKQLKSVRLRLGVSDGTYTEVLDGAELQPGTEVVTNVVTGQEQRNTTGQQGGAQNPLMGPQRRGGPGGFGGPGGGGRGR